MAANYVDKWPSAKSMEELQSDLSNSFRNRDWDLAEMHWRELEKRRHEILLSAIDEAKYSVIAFVMFGGVLLLGCGLYALGKIHW